MVNKYEHIYNQLYSHYGPQGWWPADTPFEMMMGAILVQNTSWSNVEKAIKQLKPYLDPNNLDALNVEELAQLIKPSGYFNIKAKRIKSFMEWLRRFDYKLESIKELDRMHLRGELLQIKGIGPETADVILLYAFDTPIFVVDAYAKRIFYRLGHDLPSSYDAVRVRLEEALPRDITLLNEYHALLVEHAKQHCKATPICTKCPLLDLCERRLQ